MEQNLQTVLDLITADANLSEAEKAMIIARLKEADKKMSTDAFLLQRGEQVKKTMSFLLEETIEELEQKRKAVEEKNRDLEIEAALERVRTVAMGMRTADDLLNICKILFEEFNELGFGELRNAMINIVNDEKGSFLGYDFNGDKTAVVPFQYNSHPVINRQIEITRSATDAFIEHILTGSELEDFKAFRVKNGEAPDPKLENITALYYYFYSIGDGSVGISSFNSLTEEKLEVLKRFRNVFDLAYRRYADIQLAEAQAREAQIELGLERVRARAMAMQSSGELSELVTTVSKELAKLDFALSACIINIIDGESRSNTVWFTGLEEGMAIMKFEDYPVHDAMWDAWKAKKAKYVYTLQGQEKLTYDDYLLNETEFSRISDAAKAGLRAMERFVCSFTFCNFGGLQTVGTEPLSDANLDILARFGKVFDLTYTRFNDLKQAETQAREAQIELALERVRARTMAMQHSEELAETAFILFQQFKELGENPDQATIGIINEEERVIEYWVTMYGSQINKVFKFSIDEPNVTHKIYKAWKAKKKSLVIDLSGKALTDFATYRQSMGGAKLNKGEKRRVINVAFFSKGLINVQSNEARSEESIRLLERFAGVFDGTYTRFLDLKKAEAQARESQIELALERVRAKTMAMQKSDELLETSQLVFQQLRELGATADQIGIAIVKEKEGVFELFATLYGNQMLRVFMPKIDDPFVMGKVYKGWKAEQKSFVVELSGEDLRNYNILRNKLGGSNFYNENIGPGDRWIVNCASFSKGILSFSSSKEPATETTQLLERFAKVFEQTYTRFLDLQKAEAQARESQIELALERVRARTMAMQHSEELGEAASLLFEQVQGLGLKTGSCGYNIWDKDKKATTVWVSSQGGDLQPPFKMPHTENVTYRHVHAAMERGDDFFTEEVSGKALQEHFDYLLTVPGIQDIILGLINDGYAFPMVMDFNIVFFAQGYLSFHTHEPCPEAYDIFKRFAKVFEQTYTRFLDLQKAEAQAKEAQIELALERVRARTMAMQKSEELKEIIKVVYEQLVHLNILAEHAGFIMDYQANDDMNIWLADKHFDPSYVTVPYFDSPHWNSFNEAKKKGNDFFAVCSNFEEKNKFYEDLFKLVPGATDEAKEYYFSCPGLAISTVLLDNVGLYIENFSGIPYTDEENNTLMRFGKVFQQTYTRFLDLQKAEAQAREAQIELSLERVRASAMAMHKTDQLLGAAELLYRELTGLGINSMAITYAIMAADEKSAAYYSINPVDGKINPVPFDAPHTETEVMRVILSGWKKQEAIIKLALDEEATLKHQTYIAGILQAYFNEHNFDYNFSVEAFLAVSPKKAVIYTFNFVQGYIFIIGSEHLTKPQEEMVIRFAKVFEMTYRRFLDLKQAEEQARESQIQLALERVRARTMAMQKSEELHEVIQLVFDQLQQLNFDIDVANFALNYQETDDLDLWLAVADAQYAMKILIPYFDHPVFTRFNKAKEKGGLFTDTLSKDEKNSFFKHFFKYIPSVAKERQALVFGHPGFARSAVFMKNTVLSIINYQGVAYSGAENNTLLRFGQVFDQTYTRFKDLEQAEEQARESQIQLALERVRARTMAMQKSEELPETSALLFQQVKELGEAAVQNSIAIVNEEAGFVELSTTVHGSHELRTLHVPIDDPHVMAKAVAAWKANRKSLTLEFKGQELKDYNELRNSFLKTKINFPEDLWVVRISFFSKGWLSFSFNKIVPDELIAAQMRFAAVFDQTYTRFLDLQKAEAQIREAQIEAALERVRSKTMAMHNSTDVGETVTLMFNELVKLGVDKIARCGIAIPGNNGLIELWTAKLGKDEKEEIIIGHIDTAIHPMLRLLNDAWKSKQTNFEYILEGDDLDNYITALNNYHGYPIKYDKRAWGAKQHHNDFFFPEGMVFAFTSNSLSDEIVTVLKRFAGVFGQTYRRYLDLQKAEAQAKESRIQLALERVRARTMAMQKSDELAETSVEVFRQLISLGIQPNRLFIGIIKDNSGDIELWATEEDGSKISKRFTGNMRGNKSVKKMYDGWKSHQKSLTIDMKGKELKDYFQYLVEELKVPFKLGLSQKRRVQSIAYFSQGFIGMAAPEEQPQETIDLMERFAGVFNLTYTRFNDLKMAEEQAREARIEASLERVRGKAMAMRNSADLSITASMVFTELRNLGINPIRSGVGLITKGTRHAKIYSDTSLQTDTDLSLIGEVTLSGHHVFELQYQAWLKQENCFAALEGAELAAYYKILSVGLNANLGASGKKRDKEYGHWFMFSEGFLYAWSDKSYTEAEIKILERFKNVVELTFRRYIELQQSEAIARDAVKDASLDRVRAEIASMRKRNDLERITPLIWDELTILGIPFIRCGVFIMDEEQELIHTFLSTPDGKAIGAFHIPFDTSKNFEKMVNSWRDKVPYIDHWKEEAFSQFADTLVKQGAIASKAQYMRTLPHEGVHLNFLPFLQGMLYVGNIAPLSEDNIDLIQAVAEAFSTAYARYEDFNKLEAAKQQVDKTLTDLKATQTKLIQSEKMASLGELTAGIAHEIQNPLNFVNNFSEVNQEMIDELADELKAGNIEEALAIAADIKDNEQKINHHGKRADGIVKGMLQHSRTGGGEKQATNMNALADEFLRLSYHGLRAKDKSFNAELVTHFDPDLPKINVIGQDMGRVMLNLFNNAFYAVNQKMKTAAAGYKPEVAVTTFSENGQIIIKVKDNGVGMPEHIKEKIMQPFFTTKPTGEGTGLGLSLTYDMVVKGHGGSITVDTKEGEYTEFTLLLPLS